MFYIFILLNYSIASLLQDANKLYEDLRYQTQSLLVRTPMNMVRQTLGLGTLDWDGDEIEHKNDEVEITSYQLKQHKERRLLQQGTPNVTYNVNEYYKQRPLIAIYCGLGDPMLLNVTKFYCFQEQVTQQQYMDQITINPVNCAIRYRLEYGCLCPPDFFGPNCLNWNPIWCDMEQPSKDCRILADSDYYNSKIDGNPPCAELTSLDQITEVIRYLSQYVRTVCYNRDQSKLNHTVYSAEENYTIIWSNYSRGISALMPQQYKFSAPNPEDPNDPQFYIQFAAPEAAELQHFKYSPRELYIDTNQLKSSLEFNIQPYFRQINWTMLYSSAATAINRNLTLTEMIGAEYFQIDITINDPGSLYGRYSFEIGLELILYGYQEIYEVTNTTTSNFSKPISQYPYEPQLGPKILFYEDLSFNEPVMIDKRLEKVARIISIILIIVLIILLYMIYKYRGTLWECLTGNPREDKIRPTEFERKDGLINKLRKCFRRSQVSEQQEHQHSSSQE